MIQNTAIKPDETSKNAIVNVMNNKIIVFSQHTSKIVGPKHSKPKDEPCQVEGHLMLLKCLQWPNLAVQNARTC